MSLAERAPLTRDGIVAAGREQVEAVGLHDLSLRAVARSLGVTGAALYKHVGSKQELVALIAADAFEQLADRFATVEAAEPIAVLREQAAVYIDFALAHPELFRVMMRFPPALGQDDDASALPTFDPATRVFEASLGAVDTAVREGVLAPIDPIVAALTLWSAVHGVVEVLLMGLELPDAIVEQMVASANDAVLRGLMA